MIFAEHWTGTPPDEGGECPSCGGDVDRCGCSACDRDACDHLGHCDVCGRGYYSQAEADDGICVVCSIEWLFRRGLPAPTIAVSQLSILPSEEDARRKLRSA